MAYIVTELYGIVRKIYEENQDPRISHLPLLGSPWPMFSMIALYLAFVLHYGPKWMEKRKPFNLKHIMRVYNAIQVITNLSLLLYVFMFSLVEKEYSLTCQPVDTTNRKPWMLHLLRAGYGYHLVKYLDMLDTVFFILRKKYNQITFLHVYHHAGMVFATQIFMTFLAGSHASMLGIVNAIVHVVMYSYYFVTSMRPIAQALWWKRHITQLQLLQFGYLMLHFLLVIVRNPCRYPVIIAFVGFSQNLFMFLLFVDFYYKAYIRKSLKRTKENSLPPTEDTQSSFPQQQEEEEGGKRKSNGNARTLASGKSKFV